VSYFSALCLTQNCLRFDSWFVVIVALSDLLGRLSTQTANPSRLSDDLSSLLAGFVPSALSANSSTLHSTAAELLSSMFFIHNSIIGVSHDCV